MSDSLRPPLLLIGVGGAGGRIVHDTVSLFQLDHDCALAIDTDLYDLSRITGCRTHLIGQNRLDGHGSGGDIERSIAVAHDEATTLSQLLTNTRLAIVVAGLGGGTGSGIGSELLRLTRERNIPTLVFTISPFSFEPEERRQHAAYLRTTFEERGAVVIHLENDALAAAAGPDATLDIARTTASRTAAEGIALLWRLLAHPGYIGLNIATLSTLLRSCHGRAHFATATATGETRVQEAAAALFAPDSGKLTAPLAIAPTAAIGILGGSDIRLAEVGDAMAALHAAARPECEIHLGTVQEAPLQGTLSIAALVFEKSSTASLPETETEPEPPPTHGPTDPVSRDTSSSPTPPREDSPTPPAPTPHPRTKRAARTKSPKISAGSYFLHTPSFTYNGEELDIPTYARRGLSVHVN